MPQKKKSATVSPYIVLERSDPKDILVFDCETTGLLLHFQAPLDKQPHIVEFAGYRLSGKTGNVVEKVVCLINPGVPIPPDATRIHGISDDDVQGRPGFVAVWKKTIAPVIKKCRLMIAHNAPFDLSMIDLEQRRAFAGDNVQFPALPSSLCTIGLYRDRYGYDPKLIDLYRDVCGKEFKQEHRASSDVAALVEIVQKDKLWKL